MPTADIATAVDREAAWLQTSGDTLPALQSADGGPWEVVQAYWPGARMPTQKTGIYVQRGDLEDTREATQRIISRYSLLLKLVWPVRQTTAPLAETEQRNFDAAIALLVLRIRGPVGDKTHGGRFLSVAEVPRNQPVRVVWEDAQQTIQQHKALLARVTYFADDFEVNG